MIGNLTSFKNNPINRQGEDVLKKREEPITDAHGNQIGLTTSQETVKVIFSQLSKKDLTDHSMGQAVKGTLKIYYAWDVDIINGDYLVDTNNIRWRVESIEKEYRDVYKVAIVKNFGLNES